MNNTDHILMINGLIRFIETNIKTNIDYGTMEKALGFSYKHIRKTFKAYTQVTLKKYINQRKIVNIAFEMKTSTQSLLSLSTNYGFNAYDTFTRCFKRETGQTPQSYRQKNDFNIKKGLIALGTYGPVFPKAHPIKQMPSSTQNKTTLLCGVPKVQFSTGKCTPLPACLESILNYIGQKENSSYTHLMTASGAPFRLCWHKAHWDMGNSNIMNINSNKPWKPYERVYQAAGWTCNIIKKENHTIDYFKNQIINSIQQGIPLIAIGIIGPPEATLITGYDHNGDTLHGWSYFQDNPELATGIKTDDAGYFVAENWWPNTQAILTLGKKRKPLTSKNMLSFIEKILKSTQSGPYDTGQKAYLSWIEDLLTDSYFKENTITPLKLPKFFCQADAETMIGEGRYWAAQYFHKLKEDYPTIAKTATQVEKLFNDISKYGQKMTAIRTGECPSEEAIDRFYEKATREKLAILIRKAKEAEQTATQKVTEIVSAFS